MALALERHVKCYPSLYHGRMGGLPTDAKALQAIQTVQPGHAKADIAAKEDLVEANPQVGLYVNAVSLEDHRACMEQVQS